MNDAKRDDNFVPTMLGVSSVDGVTPILIQVDPVTGRMLVDLEGPTVEAAWGDITGTLSAQTDLQTALDAKVPKSVVDAKGDLLVASAADTVTRLAVGTDGFALVADAAAPNGVKWAAVAGSAVWGGITGTLSAQTDLQTALDAKRPIVPRVQSVTSSATVTPSADNDDCVDITAQAAALDIANPTGTPVNFQKLIVRIKDNGTARAITYGTAFVAGGVALPTTTVLSKILNLGFQYNTANSLNKWQLIASAQEV